MKRLVRPCIVPSLLLSLFVCAEFSRADDKGGSDATTIVMLGDSTTAPRDGVLMVYADRIRHALEAAGNKGEGG